MLDQSPPRARAVCSPLSKLSPVPTPAATCNARRSIRNDPNASRRVRDLLGVAINARVPRPLSIHLLRHRPGPLSWHTTAPTREGMDAAGGAVFDPLDRSTVLSSPVASTQQPRISRATDCRANGLFKPAAILSPREFPRSNGIVGHQRPEANTRARMRHQREETHDRPIASIILNIPCFDYPARRDDCSSRRDRPNQGG